MTFGLINASQLCLPAHEPSNTADDLEIATGNSVSIHPVEKMTIDHDNEIQSPEIKGIKISNKQETVNEKYGQGEGFCYHLGVLIFASLFSELKKRGLSFVIQFMVSVLLGAKNIEQTKTLNHPSLELILDNPIKSPKVQRLFFKENTSKDNIKKLLIFNIEMVGLGECLDFYYDPHTKHYTGIRNILKGWCSKIRFAVKAINMDFIHSVEGYPLYLNVVDNFDDMRVRFFRDIEEFRKLAGIPKDKVITFIVDRAIFSMEVFQLIKELKNVHIITWEKNYGKDKWDYGKDIYYGSLARKGNEKSGAHFIKYQYQDNLWEKDPGLRQIIVRIDKPGNEAGYIEVSILTDDLSRNANQIILAMFNRWVQENDFKYEIAHFGIDQITTYEYADYQEVKEFITDKKHSSGAYKALTKEIGSCRERLKTSLLKLHRLKNIEKTGKKLNIKQLEKKEWLKKLIDQQNMELVQKEEKRKTMEKEISKLDELINEKKQLLKTDVKLQMDVIKIIARNAFYKSAEQFRKLYDDYRDDLLIFREITRSHGIIKKENEKLTISLLPTMVLTPKMKKIASCVIKEINRKGIEMPNRNRTKIDLQIADEIDPLFAFSF